jgi:predicted DCC family thiol-disulfide oxidoreductase YuxK
MMPAPLSGRRSKRMDKVVTGIDGKHLILYDGVCGLCNRLNQFVLPRDSQDKFRFAALQSDVAYDILNRYGRDANDLDTFYVVANFGTPSEQLYERSDAGLFVLNQIGGIYKLSGLLRAFPQAVLNWGYNRLAQSRYKIFGKHDVCIMPSPEYTAKFVDTGASTDL